MERIIDKTIVLALSCLLLVQTGVGTILIAAFLLAVSLSALCELPRLSEAGRAACPVVYCALAVAFPPLVLFLPLAAGDLFGLRWLPLRLIWVVPLVVGFAQWSPFVIIATTLFCVVACLLVLRSARLSSLLEATRVKRDDLAAAQHSLELRNRDLRERQELELRLATLGERSRIAREIHDNVGHLLTRSVLQVEALQVLHANDKPLASELAQLGAGLHTAFGTLRTSVHGLHDEALDLRTQLEALVHANESRGVVGEQGAGLAVELDFRGEGIPAQPAYAFLAIVREALSNTERHSDATLARISVADFPGFWQLVVQDNGTRGGAVGAAGGAGAGGGAVGGAGGGAGASGVGVDTARGAGGGIGLASMEERTRSLGGVFRTSYEDGFKVFVSIPKEKTE